MRICSQTTPLSLSRVQHCRNASSAGFTFLKGVREVCVICEKLVCVISSDREEMFRNNDVRGLPDVYFKEMAGRTTSLKVLELIT